MPDLPLPILLLAALALVIILAALIALFRTASRPPYQRNPDFLTPAETIFFRALEQAVNDDLYIFPKIRLADLLAVSDGSENPSAHFARISQKHIDFTLVDRQSLIPLLAIELDDSSHDRPDRQARDAFVDAALQSAGLPILHVPTQQAYDPPNLARSIRALLSSRP